MPAIAGYRSGETVQVRESSSTESATIWVNISTDLGYASAELTLDKAAGLRDQLDVLIRQHRMAVVDADIVEEEPPAPPTWRPVRVSEAGQILAITDEHGERLSIRPDPCPRCGQNSLFKGPTRTLCASCGCST